MYFSQIFAKVPGTNIRVQTLIITHQEWGWSRSQIADEYDLTEVQVSAAFQFYACNRQIIDDAIATEQKLEEAVGKLSI